MHALLLGAALGFLVALQPGPMSLFLVRSTLRGGLRVGLAVAAGIAGVDALYAAAGAAGAASLVALQPLRLGLGIVGAAVLVWLGVRTLASAAALRAGLEGPHEAASPASALRSSLGATAANPATIASWAAVFSAATVATDASPVLLVGGVALGSAAWVTVLAAVVAVLRRAATPGVVRTVDALAGCGLVGFGGLLGLRTLHDAA